MRLWSVVVSQPTGPVRSLQIRPSRSMRSAERLGAAVAI